MPNYRSLFIILALYSVSVPLKSIASPTDFSAENIGPIQNKGMAVTTDESGVQAPGYTWHPFPAVKNWTANWMGFSAQPVSGSQAFFIRTTINFPEQPKQVVFYMTGNTYILFVNGRMAARGPADAGHDFAGTPSGRMFYDARDLTPLFHPGKNAISLELFGKDGFLIQGTASFPTAPDLTIKSDANWKEISSPSLLKQTLPGDPEKKTKDRSVFVFDATAEPVGWQMPDFDDSKWTPCKVGTLPTNLVVSELPPLMETRYPSIDVTAAPNSPVDAISIPQKPFEPNQPIVINKDGSFIVHISRLLAGRVGLVIDGAAGTTLTLNSNETPNPGGRTYYLKLRDGLQTFATPDYYACGAVTVTAEHVTKPISILDLSCQSDTQPVAYLGSFTCSDDALNKLWISGRWSTQICMQTHHLDSPQHQEPIGDYGDYLIADLVNYDSMGDNPWLARQDLRKFSWVLQNAKFQTFHTSYIFYWLQSLMNYYDYTGDKALLTELAPTAAGVIDQFKSYLGPNGIISNAPNYMFMDWVKIDGIACHHPPAVIGQGYMTALFIHALDEAARVATLMHDDAKAAEYKGLHDQVLAAYNKELWNPEKGLYRDGKPDVVPKNSVTTHWLPADTQIETFSVQNNALAVLYDIAPKDRQAGIIDKLMADQPLNATPYFLHFVLNGIDHAGLFNKYGAGLLRTWKIVPETQTVREMGTSGDFSHGWIATPTYQLSSKVLGIRPTSPGFDSVAIEPNVCDLTSASGKVPSPHGLVSVSWTRNGNNVELKVTLPSGSVGTICLPGVTSATLNGTLAAISKTDQIGPDKLAAGNYVIEATGNFGG